MLGSEDKTDVDSVLRSSRAEEDSRVVKKMWRVVDFDINDFISYF